MVITFSQFIDPVFFLLVRNPGLGGVFMSLMDAYGLSLVSVQVWGILWGVLSLGFIVGGLAVSRRGLGKSPLRTLFLANIVMWVIATGFTIQASVVLLAIGMFIYLCLIPVVEAAEQTILQAVIPLERQGRVFGFAQSIEQAASPLTAFMVGPIAQFIFIPFMTTGIGGKRSRHCAFVYCNGTDWINGNVDSDAIALLPKIINDSSKVLVIHFIKRLVQVVHRALPH
jgi:hypothetical protein